MNRPIVVTEKIDGTNGCVVIEGPFDPADSEPVREHETYVSTDEGIYVLAAQSRKRIITPREDNHGFAQWVWGHSTGLVKVLGPGRHFGEWWGSGVNRGYGLSKGEKRFSLFNTRRWDVLSEHSEEQPLGILEDWTDVPGLRVVPTIAEFETFNTDEIDGALDMLRASGSFAAPGFDRPEGIVVYHRAANQLFKVTLENDQAPKSKAEETHAPIPQGVVREAMETRAQYA